MPFFLSLSLLFTPAYFMIVLSFFISSLSFFNSHHYHYHSFSPVSPVSSPSSSPSFTTILLLLTLFLVIILHLFIDCAHKIAVFNFKRALKVFILAETEINDLLFNIIPLVLIHLLCNASSAVILCFGSVTNNLRIKSLASSDTSFHDDVDDDDDDDDEQNEEEEDLDADIEKEGNINHYEYPPRQHQQPHRQRQRQQQETVDIDLYAGIEQEGSNTHYEYMQRQHQQPQNQQQDPMDIATEETRNDTIVITPNNSRQCTTSNTTHSNSYSTDNISNVDDEHSIKSTTTTTATAITTTTTTTTTQRDTSLSSNQLCLYNQGTKSQSAYSGDNSNIIDLSFNNNDTHHDNETEKYEGDKEEEEECKTTSNCNALTCSTTQITNLGTSNDQGNHNVEKETMSIFNTLWEENEMDEFDLDETEEISKNRNDGGHEKRHQDCENAYVNNETIEEIKNKDSHPGGNTEEAELSHGIIVMKPNNNTCLSNNEELNNPKVCQISTSLDRHDFNINAEGKLQKNNAENHTASIFAAFEEDDLDAFDDENDDDD
mmetsp:Transcript_12424/g.14432  ORF Transcript_12424/g.14432 Transcript_12424/m.14432 type:complete len:545 (+) Transcript_12424:234-1868(+)